VLATPLWIAISWWPFANANSSGNSAAVQQQEFTQLQSCTDSTLHPPPACPGPKDAIFSAWYWLKQRLSDSTRASSLDQYVFTSQISGLGTVNRGLFTAYLGLGQGPEFYDGEQSTAKLTTAACSSDTGTVKGYFQDSNNASWCYLSVMTCREDPTKPLRSFFEPRAISFDNQGATDFNVAMVFHEALHGFTKMNDSQLQSFLGCTEPIGNPLSGYDTRDITIYLQQFVGSQPPPSAPATCVYVENHMMPSTTNVCLRPLQ